MQAYARSAFAEARGLEKRNVGGNASFVARRILIAEKLETDD